MYVYSVLHKTELSLVRGPEYSIYRYILFFSTKFRISEFSAQDRNINLHLARMFFE